MFSFKGLFAQTGIFLKHMRDECLKSYRATNNPQKPCWPALTHGQGSKLRKQEQEQVRDTRSVTEVSSPSVQETYKTWK